MRHFQDGFLLEANVTKRETMERVRACFGAEPVPLIAADPWYGEILPGIGDTCLAVTGLASAQDGAEEAFAEWMLSWTRLWTELLVEGGAFYVWGGVGRPKFRPFYQYAHRVERETELTIGMPITWKKKRAYGVQYNYLFTREECLYLVKGDPKKPRCFHVPLTDEKRGYSGYNPKYPAKSEFLRRSAVWTEDGAPSPGNAGTVEYRMSDVWDETEVLRAQTTRVRKSKTCQRDPYRSTHRTRRRRRGSLCGLGELLRGRATS